MIISRSIHVAANDTTELIYTTETDSQTLKTNSWLPERKGRVVLEVVVGMCILMFMEWVVNRDLLYSTENSIRYSVIPNIGKESETEWICVYG